MDVVGCTLSVLALSLTTCETMRHPSAEYGGLLSRASEEPGLASSSAIVGSLVV